MAPKATHSKSKSTSSSHISDAAMPSLGSLLNSGLTSSFEAIRDKISQSVTENGEEYLKEAAEKITKSTSQVVEWSRKNPIKLAVGVAALLAVSAFLVHTMKNPEAASIKGAVHGAKRLATKAKTAMAKA
jgi:hypothetical protein